MKKILQEYGLLLVYLLSALIVCNLLTLYKDKSKNSIISSTNLAYTYKGEYNTYIFQVKE